MSGLRSYEMPWRPVWEVWATITWAVATVVMLGVLIFTRLPREPFVYMLGVSALMLMWRVRQAQEMLNFKLSLSGKPFSFIRKESVIQIMKENPNDMFYGFGFVWSPIHTQRAIEIRKRDIKEILPPDWFLKFKGLKPEQLKRQVGQPWIHGLEPKEELILGPLKSREGHTIVFGTTGAGKTRLLELMMFQDILRGDVVIMIDPKGDKEAMEIMKRAAELAGRPFVYFHPAFPSKSARIDTLKNFSRSTEIASRIGNLLGDQDSFVAYAWRSINQTSEAMLYVGERPNLVKIKRVIETGCESLAEKVLRAFFEENVPRWSFAIEPLISMVEKGKLKPPTPVATKELTAMLAFYQSNNVPDSIKNGAVDGIVSMLIHPREHAQKMLTVLVPLLSMLTAGELGKLLAPDADDIDDPRPIYDTAKMVDQRAVVYIGTDSLSDTTTGSAIGSIILADIAAYAGSKYNYGGEKVSIQLYCDESAETVNDPTIQLLNKGRGADIKVNLFAQTFPDFVVRMGSEPKARKLLGNANTLIALRTKCRVTQDFIVETLGETHVQQVSRSQGQGSRSEDSGMEFSGNVSETLADQKSAVFPPELLGMLQDLHYVGMFSGGTVVKGRISKLV